MIASDAERVALMALIDRYGRNCRWTAKSSAPESESVFREASDGNLAAIWAMLAPPDDAVIVGENVINDDGEPEGYDRYKIADALYNGRGWELEDLGLALVRVLRGEATRDESS